MPLSHNQVGDASWEFVPSQPVPCFSGIRSKRGRALECEQTAMEENRFPEQVLLPAKRVCIRDINCQQLDHDMNENLPGCLKDYPLSSSSLSALTANCSSNNRTTASATPTYLPSMVDGYHNSYNNHYNNHNTNLNNSSILNSSPSLSPITEDKALDHSDTNNNNNDELMMEEEEDFSTTTTSSLHNRDLSTDNFTSSAVDSSSQGATMETELVTSTGNASKTSSSGAYCGYSSCRGLKPSPVSGRPFCHCSASWRGMYGMEAAYFNDYY